MDLDREDQVPRPPQGADGGGEQGIERTEVDQHIGNHDQIETRGVCSEIITELGLLEDVIAATRFCSREHIGRQIHARQVRGIGRQHRTAQARATAAVQHRELARRLDVRRQRRRHVLRAAIGQALGQLGIEVFGVLVEDRFDEGVGRARRYVLARAGRQQVARNWIMWIFFYPGAIHRRRFVKATQRVVSDAQHAFRFVLERTEHEGLTVILPGLFAAFLPRAEIAQIVERRDELRIGYQRLTKRRVGFVQALESCQHRAQVVVQIGVSRR